MLANVNKSLSSSDVLNAFILNSAICTFFKVSPCLLFVKYVSTGFESLQASPNMIENECFASPQRGQLIPKPCYEFTFVNFNLNLIEIVHLSELLPVLEQSVSC